MFLSRAAFEDSPAEGAPKPRSGGFNTVSRTLNKAPPSGPPPEEPASYGRHATPGVDYYRPSTASSSGRPGTAGGGDDSSGGAALPTSGESRASQMERQKQLYSKRRTDVVSGGVYTAARPVDGAAYTPAVPQFSAPKSLGDALSGRPSTAGSSMTFGTARPTTADTTLGGITTGGGDAPLPSARDTRKANDAPASRDERRGGASGTSGGDFGVPVDSFVPSPEATKTASRSIGATGGAIIRNRRDDDNEGKLAAAPTRAERTERSERAPEPRGSPTADEPPPVTYERSSRKAAPVVAAHAPAPETLSLAERELAARGLASTFDPSSPVASGGTGLSGMLKARVGGAGPATLDLSDIDTFLNTPTPKAVGIVQCYIERDKTGLGKKMYPVYQLYLKEGDRFLLASKKRPKQKTSNYLISRVAEDLTRDSDSFAGKLRSNFVGTEFTVYDHGVNPEDARKRPDLPIRSELACCTYASNVFGSRGPRKMKVFVPRVFPDNSRTVFQPVSEKDSMLAMAARGETANIVQLINKPPKWNDQVGAYVLNFNGRVTMASVKNFQLVPSDDHDSVVLQFGRVGKDLFTMDYQWPLSPLQAFAICLSSFDYKLACE